jgi:hypothetical protein
VDDHDAAVAAGDDRVQVELGDLGQVFGQPGHPEQRVAERRLAGGGTADGRGPAARRQRPGTD